MSTDVNVTSHDGQRRAFSRDLSVACTVCAVGAFWRSSILLFGLALILGVVAVVLDWRRARFGVKATVFLSLALAAAKLPAIRSSTRDQQLISDLVATEEQILALTPHLKRLGRAVQNLQVPDVQSRALFCEQVECIAPNGDSSIMVAAEASIASALLDGVSWFEQAKFKIIDGHYLEGNTSRFESRIEFDGLARMTDGTWQGLESQQMVTWQKSFSDAVGHAGDKPVWRISRWQTDAVKASRISQPLFRESLFDVLRKETDYQTARRSVHQEAAVQYYQAGSKKPPHPYFAPISANQKPGLAVADIDGDGDDDIYVTVRLGKNLLLENQGDGTFVESAAVHGLDVDGHTTCALFADFDNDGDADAVLGRSLLPSLYMENEDGYFRVAKDVHLPRLAISLSAADYNRDGLLDLYLCTYRPATLDSDSSPSGGVAGEAVRWPDEFLSPGQAHEYYRRHAAGNSESEADVPNLLDQIGPPNVLYVNRGNALFELADESATVGVWRNSLQATWADYDEDGDPDLYIANDWGPDNFFRNDGDDGFVEVSMEAGVTGFGFAMGATWGDYDNDGRQDLYVSNMYSKAGRRITRRIAGLAPQYLEAAAGNYLYRHGDRGRFKLVSGDSPTGMNVGNAGWSWGGQFADFDNDGFLDLYVLSGYFTAPAALASSVDL